MKKEREVQDIPLLADMHADGIRFDAKIKDVLKLHNKERNARAIRDSHNR